MYLLEHPHHEELWGFVFPIMDRHIRENRDLLLTSSKELIIHTKITGVTLNLSIIGHTLDIRVACNKLISSIVFNDFLSILQSEIDPFIFSYQSVTTMHASKTENGYIFHFDLSNFISLIKESGWSEFNIVEHICHHAGIINYNLEQYFHQAWDKHARNTSKNAHSYYQLTSFSETQSANLRR